jgi:hypothetical protein
VVRVRDVRRGDENEVSEGVTREGYEKRRGDERRV